jgi:hypothetical protein
VARGYAENPKNEGVNWIGGVAEGGDAADPWKRTAEEFEAFAMQLRCHQRDAGDVTARASQARNQTQTYRVACHNDDRNLTPRPLHGKRAGRVKRHDDIDLERDKLGRKLGQQGNVRARRTELILDSLPFNKAAFAQSFAQLCPEGCVNQLTRKKPVKG